MTDKSDTDHILEPVLSKHHQEKQLLIKSIQSKSNGITPPDTISLPKLRVINEYISMCKNHDVDITFAWY
jgi:hypothetical protein